MAIFHPFIVQTDPIKVASLTVQIVTPEGSFLDEPADYVELPTAQGELGIFPGHTNLIAELGTGEMRVRQGQESKSFAIAGGFVEVETDLVRVAASFASAGEDAEAIEAAIQRAGEALKQAESLPPERIEQDLALLRTHLSKIRPRRPVGTR
jgi:F-type H+-transporting ATPase subunit epsilon